MVAPLTLHDHESGRWVFGVAGAASGFRRLGIRTGDRIAILAFNSDLYIEAFYSIAWAGAVAVPLNYRLTSEEALYVINHSDAEVAYVDYEHVPMFAVLRGQLE